MKFLLLILLGLVATALFFLLGYIVFRRIFPRAKDPERVVKHTLDKLAKTQGPEVPERLRAAAASLDQWESREVETASFDHVMLRGRYFPNPQPCGKTMILLHGYRSTGALDFGPQFAFLRSLGCNLLLVDQRAHGNSQGEFTSLGVAERFDAIVWAAFVEKLSGPEEGVIFYGCSMGGTTALLTTSEEELNDNVIGVIADSAYIGPWLQLMARLRRRHIPLNPTMNIIDILCMAKARFSIRDCTATNAMPHCQVPVLLIHGDGDRLVSWDDSRILSEQCAAPCTFLKVPGAGHCLSYLTDAAAYEKAVADFVASLEGPPRPLRAAREEENEEPEE